MHLNSKVIISYNLLVKYNIQIGHYKKFWNTTNSLYIYGIRTGFFYINLLYTWYNLRKLLKFIINLAERKKLIWIINNKSPLSLGVRHCLKNLFFKSKNNFLEHKWIPGLFTNFWQKIAYVKKTKIYFGFNSFRKIPSLVWSLSWPDYCPNWVIAECLKLNIPSASLVDTNQNPFGIAYPIASNNDNLNTILFFCILIKKAILIGFLRRILRFNCKKECLFLKLKFKNKEINNFKLKFKNKNK